MEKERRGQVIRKRVGGMPHCAELFKVERSLHSTDALAGPGVVSTAAARFYCTSVSPIDMQFAQPVHIKLLHLKSAPATFGPQLLASVLAMTASAVCADQGRGVVRPVMQKFSRSVNNADRLPTVF